MFLIMFLIGFSFILNGCANNHNANESHSDYDIGFQDGYDDGYGEGYNNGLETCLNTENYEDEYLEFQSTIITLMYDYEYETVEKMFEYYPEAVGSFLIQEFGTDNIPEIIDYLESEREVYPDTIVGKCMYCGEDVFYKDVVHITSIHEPHEISYAHHNCVDQNEAKVMN